MRKHIIFAEGRFAGDSENDLYAVQLEGYTDEEAIEIVQTVPANQSVLWDISTEPEREIISIEHTQKDNTNA